MYQIDTEGTAVVKLVGDSESKEEIAEPSMETSSALKVRVPSIQFLGKEGWMKKLSVSGESSSTPTVTHLKPNHSNILSGSNISPTYGRLPFSEREMEALLMGGASETDLL